MKDFIELINTLDQTTKTLPKIKALGEYFLKADEEDKIWALALLTERRPRRTVNTTFMRLWAAEKASIPVWLFEESYHVVGDLAESIALLTSRQEVNNDFSLSQWMKEIMSLEKNDEQEKKAFILNAWEKFDYYHSFIFNKLITGGLRIGVSEKLVIKALAQIHEVSENIIAHRISGNWTPDKITYQSLLGETNIKEDISKPYPFYLAYPLENEISTIGQPEEWQAEWKWDGLRGQLIKRQGEFFVWSRGEELVTDKFTELQALRELLPDGTVIDGEIICWQNNAPLPFQVLQTRIGRKNASAKFLKEAPIVLIAYDLMELDGEDLRNKPLSYRRNKLDELVKDVNLPILNISEILNFDSWEILAELRNQSRINLSEGLMLKKRNSVYETGRRRGNWWKWKIEPYSIDGVLIYAQKGHGRRADLFTDYTFAVWDQNALVPFTKAYSGLTDKELIEVDKFVKRNTLEKFGPVRSVTPELVFELAFEGINKSTRHKSGVALRFPRILRWRKDKKPEDADTLDNLKALTNI